MGLQPKRYDKQLKTVHKIILIVDIFNLNKKKCQFQVAEVMYLGDLVTPDMVTHEMCQ